jgi:hypothetical protein
MESRPTAGGRRVAELANRQRNSIDINMSGPGRITLNEDGSLSVRVEGRNLVFFFPGDLGPNEPGALYLTTGLITETISPLGEVVPGTFAATGTVTNLCTLLA